MSYVRASILFTQRCGMTRSPSRVLKAVHLAWMLVPLLLLPACSSPAGKATPSPAPGSDSAPVSDAAGSGSPVDSHGATPSADSRVTVPEPPPGGDPAPVPRDGSVDRAPRPPDTTFPEPSAMGMPSIGTIAVNLATPGAAVPVNFVGLSLEWSSGLSYLGIGGAANPSTVELFK